MQAYGRALHVSTCIACIYVHCMHLRALHVCMFITCQYITCQYITCRYITCLFTALYPLNKRNMCILLLRKCVQFYEPKNTYIYIYMCNHIPRYLGDLRNHKVLQETVNILCNKFVLYIIYSYCIHSLKSHRLGQLVSLIYGRGTRVPRGAQQLGLYRQLGLVWDFCPSCSRPSLPYFLLLF